VNISLFEEVWYKSERDLAVICRSAEQKLSFEIHTPKLQLDFSSCSMIMDPEEQKLF